MRNIDEMSMCRKNSQECKEYQNTKNYYRNRPERLYESAEASKSVQAFINNFTFPSTLAEFDLYFNNGLFDIEILLQDEETEWTIPKWAKEGDIVLFMHGRTAIQSIRRVSTELEKKKYTFSAEDYQKRFDMLQRARNLYDEFGGKIMAIGRVGSKPYVVEYTKEENDLFHWKSRFFSDIDSIVILENPIDLSEFKNFISLSTGGAITPVLGYPFKRMKELIASKNKLPKYVRESISINIPVRDINKYNWIEVASKYRRQFKLEAAFRSYYVDYLLNLLGDYMKIFRECNCMKPANPTSRVDNVIMFGGRYLPVEVKVNINTEINLVGQVIKYCNVEKCYLNKDDELSVITYRNMYSNNVLIIDTDGIYLYDSITNNITPIYDLDNLNSRNDIKVIRDILLRHLYPGGVPEDILRIRNRRRIAKNKFRNY